MMARAGADRDDVQRRQSEGFAAERWLQRTMFPGGKVLNRKGPGDIMLPTGEVLEVKSVPLAGAAFVNAGDRPPKHRTIVVVTEGPEASWFVLGEIVSMAWVRGRPQFVSSSQLCWYAPRAKITCVREWGCKHE
jgi:hypothetical protein